MHMRYPSASFFICLALICSACDRSDHRSSTSTAVLDADGTIRTREATAQEQAGVEDLEQRGAAVDTVFPRPMPPTERPHYRGVRVLAPGSVELTDGRVIRLDGVRCSSLGLEYLSRYVLAPDTSLLVVPTGDAHAGAISADLWTVDHSGGAAIYMFPAETAITSGWCDPDGTGKHAPRYEALAKAFANERAKFLSDAR